MSQYPNSGNNQWGNVNFNNNSSYGYGYENLNNPNNLNSNTNNFNNKPQYNSYGYSENTSGWQNNQNIRVNNQNNGWGKPYQNLNSYGYSDINNYNQSWNNQAKSNYAMNIVGSSYPQKLVGLDSISKLIDWDQALREKNFAKQRSDTSWVTYQQQSWKKEKHSDAIQKQVQRKFAFPNPYIKYKIIPGVDQKKALDVTSKDQLEKGLVKGNLIIWDYHGGPNQQFYIQRIVNSNNFSNNESNLEQDEFLLINASTGFCVSRISQTNKNFKKNSQNTLCVYPKLPNNQISQRWKLKKFQNSENIFIIGWAGNNCQTVLDCQNQSSSNGTNVVQWTLNNGKNQLWKILPA